MFELENVAPVVIGRVPVGIVFCEALSLDDLQRRGQEISTRIEEIDAKEEWSNEEQDEYSQLSVQLAALAKRIEAKKTIAALQVGTGRATAPDGMQAGANASGQQPAGGKALVPAAPRREDRRGGFESVGEFALAVRHAAGGRQPDQRLVNAATTYSSESVGADGGYAVPQDFRNEIMQKVFGDESLAARTDRMPLTGNTLTMPIDMTTPWQTTGGIQAYWTGEGQTKTQSKVALEDVTVKLSTLAALVPVTEELLEDAPAMDAYLRSKVPAKLNFKLDWAIAWGTGAGMPLGFMNSPCLVTVAAESAQTTDTVNATNVSKMYGRMPVSSRATAVWIVHPDLEATLPLMTLGNQPVYLPPGGLADAPLGRLLGRPVIPHQVTETIGDLGDIMFVDLQQYILATKRGNGRDENGMRTDVSIHLWFDQDMVAYRFTIRAGGQPWWSTATSMRDGNNTMSPFITLASR